MLLSVLLLIMAASSLVSLLIVGQRMREQVRVGFTRELGRSQQVSANVETDRLRELAKEDRLLADLPSLKALLTTDDDSTIADGAVEFWKTSGNDLFALTGPDFHMRAAFVRGLPVDRVFRADLEQTLATSGRPYLVSEDHLFHLAVAPVYFGSESAGTLLGYVLSGDRVDAAYASHLSRETGADVVFLSGHAALASSAALPDTSVIDGLSRLGAATRPLTVDGQRSLARSRDLSAEANRPLAMVCFKLLQAADAGIHDIGRLLLLTGAGILLIGSLLMVFVAHRLTRPLQELAAKVRRFGEEQPTTLALTAHGTSEIRQLAQDFAIMQERVELSNRARLESERLATIGSMANSVSHDLRHYLASIYANAEFLVTPGITPTERAEFFADIQTAVMGTTDMLESLLIFSRTGQTATHQSERLEELARRAVDQMRTHPDAGRVAISLAVRGSRTEVLADGRQLERLMYNLLLNACQAARQHAASPEVLLEIFPSEPLLKARVTDNGSGIPATMSEAVFDPFVSQGKQNGTGLGLTLCRRIAEEHGGRVLLVESGPGKTVFELILPLLTEVPAPRTIAYAERLPS